MAEIQVKVKKGDFQDRFLFSKCRYPAIIAGIGTGKTYMLLLKIWKFCEDYPGALALIVRKEYTDLHDSTIKDFERYFGVKVGVNKDYRFPNGSTIMFRHGDEVNVLKNINLSIFGIEQAEEFENEETFTFLRDRLRNEASPIRQGCVIANSCGHNWIWKLWINNPQEEFEAVTATTFDNQDNLPKDFIQDLRRMELESPNHYAQYVMNSFEDVDADDVLLNHEIVYASCKLQFFQPSNMPHRIMAVDVARYGQDEIVYTILENYGAVKWEQIHQIVERDKPLTWTAGQILTFRKDFDLDTVVIDDCGVGGGVTDVLGEKINDDNRLIPFNSNNKSANLLYTNIKDEGYFKLKEWFDKGWLKILDDQVLQEQLLSIRFEYRAGKKTIVSKDKMRAEGLKSPDRADALMMAVFYAERTFEVARMSEYGKMDADLLHLAFAEGIK